MKKQTEEQLNKIENELFSSLMGLSIASILTGSSTKEKEIELLEETKRGFQRNIDKVNQGIEVIRNLKVMEAKIDVRI